MNKESRHCVFLLEEPIQPMKLQLPHRHQQSVNSLFKLWDQRGIEVTKPCQITHSVSRFNGVDNVVDANALIPGSTSSASMHQPSSAIWILASAYSWTEILSKPGLMGIQR